MKTKIIQAILARFERVSESQETALADYYDSALDNLKRYSRTTVTETTEKRPFNGSESALCATLESACFAFLCERVARTIAQAMVERFQDKREGITRKATGAQDAHGRRLYSYSATLSASVLSSRVSPDTLADMASAALAAIGAHLAENPRLDSAGIFAACKGARLTLNRHQRDERRESALEDGEADFLSALAEENSELNNSRSLAIQTSAERIKTALAAYWQASGSRKAKFGLAGDCEIVSMALAIVNENEGTENWHKRQNSRKALYERLSVLNKRIQAGFELIGERPDTLRALHGAHDHDESAHRIASADCAVVLPDLYKPESAAHQITITRTITSADKRAMRHVARSQRQSVRECEQGAWIL